MKKEDKKPTWQELPEGDILDPGTANEFVTGGWRSTRPVHHAETCIHCLRCWISCPDSSIIVKDGKVTGIDYEHCKGCGICAKECPVKNKTPNPITMEEEKK